MRTLTVSLFPLGRPVIVVVDDRWPECVVNGERRVLSEQEQLALARVADVFLGPEPLPSMGSGVVREEQG